MKTFFVYTAKRLIIQRVTFFFTYALYLDIVDTQSHILIELQLMIFSHCNICLEIEFTLNLNNTHHP